jgi:hypothetical protein
MGMKTLIQMGRIIEEIITSKINKSSMKILFIEILIINPKMFESISFHLSLIGFI